MAAGKNVTYQSRYQRIQQFMQLPPKPKSTPFFLLRAAGIIIFFFIVSFLFWKNSTDCYWIFLIFLLVFHLVEYLLHRFILHSKAPVFISMNYLHTLHHNSITEHGYLLSDKNHVATILMGPLPLILSIVGAGIPLSALVGLLFMRWDVFFAVVSAFVLYVGIYEGMHLLAHIPPKNHFLYRLLILPVSKHHQEHHSNQGDLCAFGVATPLFDSVFHTNLKDLQADKKTD